MVYFFTELIQRKSHNIIVATIDLLHQSPPNILYTVTSGLVQWFLTRCIHRDRFFRVVSELNMGAIEELVRTQFVCGEVINYDGYTTVYFVSFYPK